jgi:O-acetyl-ADP-ribose deacetylase
LLVTARLGPIKVGEAVITPAFNLSAKYVVHTVCPRYIDGQRGERELLAEAYRSALSFYDEVPNKRRISFVSMGTGVYRWPLEVAAEIAIKELALSKFEVTTMCVIDEATRTIYQRAYSRLDI